MEDERHFPPGAEPEQPAKEQPKAEEPKAEAPKEDAPKGDDPKPGEEKPPEAEKPKDEAKPEPEPTLPKKRSIYDDLKDTRKELKETKQRLQELEKGDAPADKPAPKADAPAPADELEAFAKEHEVDAKSLTRLAEIITKRVPQAQLSADDKAALADLSQWREQQSRDAEDREVLSQAAAVKAQLSVHDDAELQNVMQEIVKLAHTPAFHDKEVEYIVWKNRDALSKLVSPKKPSFESGGGKGEAQPEAAPDFSSGKVTPQQVQKAVTPTKPTYEVSNPK